MAALWDDIPLYCCSLHIEQWHIFAACCLNLFYFKFKISIADLDPNLSVFA
jgi:hypothetical protein